MVLVDRLDLVLLGGAEFLNDGLLGGLGGDAPEVPGGDLDFDQVAELGVLRGILGPGVVQGDLLLAVADEVHHLDRGVGPDVEGGAVEFDAEIADGAEALAAGDLQGGFHELGQGFAVELALALHIFKYSQQFVVHISILLPTGASHSVPAGYAKEWERTHSHKPAELYRRRQPYAGEGGGVNPQNRPKPVQIGQRTAQKGSNNSLLSGPNQPRA